MDDAGLVSAHLAGDRDAFAAIYDRYADRLHDFCHSVLRDRHEAADALQDTMLVAHQRLHQLREPERLRPWLFSIARHESYRRSRQRARTTPIEDLGVDMTGDESPPDGRMRAEDASRIVWDAAAGLAPRDQIVLDLHVRQGLSGGDLGEALGVTAHHADVLVSRVRQRVERSLGALLVSRLGRDDCEELGQLLHGWDGTFSVLMRKRVARHVDACDVCDDTRTRVAGPVALLGAIPLVPAPSGLRDRVLGEVERISATRPTGSTTSPRWKPPPLYRTSGRRRVGAAAVVALLALAGLGYVVARGSPSETIALSTDVSKPTSPETTDADHVDDDTDDVATTQTSPAEPATGTEPATETAGDGDGPPTPPSSPSAPGQSTIPGPGGVVAPAPGPTPPASTSTTSTSTPSTSGPTTSTAPPRMAVATSSISLTPERPASSISIRNGGGGELAWSASSARFELPVTSGRLGPGASTTIDVVLPGGTAEGDHQSGVVVEGAGTSAPVMVHVDRRPDIRRTSVAPSPAACGDTVRVAAVVTDESPLTVLVRWASPSDSGEVPMTRGTNDTWSAGIRASGGPMTFRVIATDGRGNVSAVGAGTVEVSPCRTRSAGGPGFTVG